MKQLICGFLLLGMIGCEEASDISPDTQNTGLIAVEGVMTNQNTNHVVKISLPYQQLNGIPLPVTNASVSISDGSSEVVLTHTDNGKYLTPTMRFLSDKVYQIKIIYQGNEIIAQDAAVPVESMPALSFDAVENGYRINFYESGARPNYTSYDISWNDTPSCTGGECEARAVYYDLKGVDTNELFKPAKTELIVPPGAVVRRMKYSVSAAYRAYLRSMLSETQWRGSVFDVQRDNAPTNLSKGAIGFFAVTTTVSETIKMP